MMNIVVYLISIYLIHLILLIKDSIKEVLMENSHGELFVCYLISHYSYLKHLILKQINVKFQDKYESFLQAIR